MMRSRSNWPWCCGLSALEPRERRAWNNRRMPHIDVLIPTFRRKTGLAVVLTSLACQTFQDFDVIVSDQTPEGELYLDSIEIQTLARALRWRGHRVSMHRH